MCTYILTSMFQNGFNDEVTNVFERIIIKRDKFVFVASEFEKNHEKTDKYFKYFLKMFEERGIFFKEASVVDGRMTVKKAEETIKSADVIWLAGGDTPTQFKYLKKYNLINQIKEYQGVVIGMSAGSINMAKTAICTLHCGHFNQEIYEGLGLVDISVEPHFTRENVSEELLELSKKYTKLLMKLY